MPKIDRATLSKIAPDPQSVKAFEDLFSESSDSSGAIVTVTKLANAAQTTANAANLAAGQAQASADAAGAVAAAAKLTADGAAGQITIIESPDGASSVGIQPARNVTATNVQDAITALDANDGSGFRNVVLNGSFIVNQRQYASGTPTTLANQYTLDRWRVVVSGQGLLITPSTNGNRVTAPAGGMEQVIEGALIVDTTYVINWIGNALGYVNGSPFMPGDFVTLAAGANCTLKFVGGDVERVQLEQGKTPHPFEPRPYTIELRLCQRYAFRWNSLGTCGVCGASTGGGYSILFPVPMRAVPTHTSITLATFSDGGGTIAITAIFVFTIDATGAVMSFSATGTTVGRAAVLYSGGAALFSAEF